MRSRGVAHPRMQVSEAAAESLREAAGSRIAADALAEDKAQLLVLLESAQRECQAAQAQAQEYARQAAVRPLLRTCVRRGMLMPLPSQYGLARLEEQSTM